MITKKMINDTIIILGAFLFVRGLTIYSLPPDLGEPIGIMTVDKANTLSSLILIGTILLFVLLKILKKLYDWYNDLPERSK